MPSLSICFSSWSISSSSAMAIAQRSSSRWRSPVMARSRLRSVRLDIMRTLLRKEASASSNVPRMCLGSIMRLTETAGDVFLGLTLGGVGKDFRGVIHFDEPAKIKEGGAIGATAGLLHVVGYDHDRVMLF